MAGEGEKGFKVEDRRRFSPETGEPREQVREDQAPQGGEETGRKQEAGREELPEISFSAFVISLSTQVLMHLGEIPNPQSGKVESDIPVAKQMIDILALLREKTRGNLDRGEEKLMDDILYDLRMKFVEAVNKR